MDVIRDSVEWRQLWSQATRRRTDPPPRPTVNFEENMVVYAAAGRMDPGGEIRVDSAGVRYEPEVGPPPLEYRPVFRIVVTTVEGCSPLQSDRYPVHIVRIPRFDELPEDEIEWAEISRTRPGCEATPG